MTIKTTALSLSLLVAGFLGVNAVSLGHLNNQKHNASYYPGTESATEAKVIAPAMPTAPATPAVTFTSKSSVSNLEMNSSPTVPIQKQEEESKIAPITVSAVEPATKPNGAFLANFVADSMNNQLGTVQTATTGETAQIEQSANQASEQTNTQTSEQTNTQTSEQTTNKPVNLNLKAEAVTQNLSTLDEILDQRQKELQKLSSQVNSSGSTTASAEAGGDNKVTVPEIDQNQGMVAGVEQNSALTDTDANNLMAAAADKAKMDSLQMLGAKEVGMLQKVEQMIQKVQDAVDKVQTTVDNDEKTQENLMKKYFTDTIKTMTTDFNTSNDGLTEGIKAAESVLLKRQSGLQVKLMGYLTSLQELMPTFAAMQGGAGPFSGINLSDPSSQANALPSFSS